MKPNFSRIVYAAVVILGLSSLCTRADAQSKPKFMVDSIAFYQVTEVQKTPVWCWAASIAMTLGAQGVRWRQEDVVVATKGQLRVETATAEEMSRFLHGWKGLDYRGNRWAVESTRYGGPPPLPVMKSSLESGKPLIITYRTGPNSEHAVVLYGANILDNETRLHSVYFFDPYTGKKGAASAADFERNTTNTWSVVVVKE